MKEGWFLAAVVVRVPAGPRADDPLDEVAHGKEQQQDQDARQLPRQPAYVIEESADGELAARHRGAGTAVTGGDGVTALMAIVALDFAAGLERFTSGNQACRQKGANVHCSSAAGQTGRHFWISVRMESLPDASQMFTGLSSFPFQLCGNYVMSQPLRRGAGQQVPSC